MVVAAVLVAQLVELVELADGLHTKTQTQAVVVHTVVVLVARMVVAEQYQTVVLVQLELFGVTEIVALVSMHRFQVTQRHRSNK
jgi:hypothetical protein